MSDPWQKYQQMAHENVDWAQVAQQWMQMKTVEETDGRQGGAGTARTGQSRSRYGQGPCNDDDWNEAQGQDSGRVEASIERNQAGQGAQPHFANYDEYRQYENENWTDDQYEEFSAQASNSNGLRGYNQQMHSRNNAMPNQRRNYPNNYDEGSGYRGSWDSLPPASSSSRPNQHNPEPQPLFPSAAKVQKPKPQAPPPPPPPPPDQPTNNSTRPASGQGPPMSFPPGGMPPWMKPPPPGGRGMPMPPPFPPHPGMPLPPNFPPFPPPWMGMGPPPFPIPPVPPPNSSGSGPMPPFHPFPIWPPSNGSDGSPSPPVLDAAARKKLPAWILEGLEKAEREKQKQLEKEERIRKAEEERQKRRQESGKGKFDSSSDEEDNGNEENDGMADDERSRSTSGGGIRGVNDDDEDAEEGADSELRSPKLKFLEMSRRNYEQKREEALESVKMLMMAVLMKGTDEALRSTIENCLQEAGNGQGKSKDEATPVLLHKSSALAAISSLGGADSSDSDSDEESGPAAPVPNGFTSSSASQSTGSTSLSGPSTSSSASRSRFQEDDSFKAPLGIPIRKLSKPPQDKQDADHVKVKQESVSEDIEDERASHKEKKKKEETKRSRSEDDYDRDKNPKKRRSKSRSRSPHDRSRDRERDRDRDRESRRRSRSRSRERDRDRDRDKASSRDRHRDRERDRSGGRRSRSKSRERDRERDRYRGSRR